GGRGGIRTHERREPLPVFKTGAFNHSATHPLKKINYLPARRIASNLNLPPDCHREECESFGLHSRNVLAWADSNTAAARSSVALNKCPSTLTLLGPASLLWVDCAAVVRRRRNTLG
ncbi:MAG: hypothetical protein QOF03_1074, partial [Alphaproteobacteria bacterium]|nr:hypothetical protein [Alphaproteobacteria bacterium]